MSSIPNPSQDNETSSRNTSSTKTSSTTTHLNSDHVTVRHVFVNEDGTICLTPSIPWLCEKFHLGKGSISDLYTSKKLCHKGWYYVGKHWLPAVYSILNKPPEWFPGVVGVYKCPKEEVDLLIISMVNSCKWRPFNQPIKPTSTPTSTSISTNQPNYH